jgi:hypothetical protein
VSIRRITPENQLPGRWLNPRRKDHAERLIEFMAWHGQKIVLPDAYIDIKAEKGLDRHQADSALDDLYVLGNVDITGRGDIYWVRLLSTDLDTPPSAPSPRFVLAGRGQR